jgi:hypothetical protein
MLETLKKRVNKLYIKIVIFLVIIAVILLALSKFSIFTIIAGPTALDGKNLESMEGKYVTVEVKYPLEIYEEDYSENTSTHEKRTTDYGYVVYDEQSEEFYGIIIDKDRQREVESVLEEAYEVLDGTKTEVEHSVTITGTVTKMDSESLSYFNKTMNWIFSDEYTDVDEAWYIDDNSVKGFDVLSTYVFTIFAGIPLLIAIIPIICIATGAYKNSVKKYLRRNPQVTMEQLECEFAMATQAHSGAWLGQTHLFMISGSRFYILDNKDIVWAYYYCRSGQYSISQLRVFKADKKMTAINMSRSEVMAVLECMADRLPHVMLGYDKELDKKFKRDFQGFLELRYNPVQRQATNPYA